MAKATLTFNLEDEDDKHKYDEMMKASNYSQALWEFDQEFLRANIKHGLQKSTLDDILLEMKKSADWQAEFEEQNPNSPKEETTPEQAVAAVIETTLEYVRTKLYEYMNESNGNPFV